MPKQRALFRTLNSCAVSRAIPCDIVMNIALTMLILILNAYADFNLAMATSN